MNEHAATLRKKIEERRARIAIAGLGYVGLPLLLEFHRAGFPVTGLDIDPVKIEKLSAGQSYIQHISSESVAEVANSASSVLTVDYSAAADCDAVLLCVPTPLTSHREPDISYVEGTCRSLAPHVRAGQLYILESTTYPGTTEEVMAPALESGGLKAGEDFFVAYSPEREDPNNKNYKTATIPKIVGGMNSDSLAAAKALYDTIIVQTVPVSSCAVAEAAKLLENIFRSVNIAMVNEMKVLFERMGIDVWEVINAAKTKPFGYMPFYPGPGLGGHCIPIDPFYLTWKAREYDMATKFIELAGEINTAMPEYVVSRVAEALNEFGKPIRGSKIFLVGLAYKSNVDDLRESPSLRLIRLLEQRGADVIYHDPHIPEIKPTRQYPELSGRESVPLSEAARCDLTLIATAHDAVDHGELGRLAQVIVDTRNAMAGLDGVTAKVFKA